ncbi:MAG: hypothetical protein JXA78_01460 [Anaerolineales bacterium]|nr:hypothetical protein [Anaerolineales bacterium]
MLCALILLPGEIWFVRENLGQTAILPRRGSRPAARRRRRTAQDERPMIFARLVDRYSSDDFSPAG